MTKNEFEIKIDQEFEFLIPALSKKEFEQLDQNIQKDGCTDPIKIWAGHDIILDGHNRYRICSERSIQYKTHPIELKTREEAINWIIENQLGRRNLTESQKSYLRGKRYNIEKKLPHRPEKGAHNDHLKTSEKIAQVENKSQATVRRDAKYAEAVDLLKDGVGPEFSKKLMEGEIKLPKTDVIKLANKPAEERAALVDKIQKGAKRLSEAEIALETKKPQPKETFTKAGADIEFAGWAWDPRKLDAPKNTPAPQSGSEIKQRLVYLTEDIFGDDFTEEETKEIIRTMRESPQWIFMVDTNFLEKLNKIDWPLNIWLGYIVYCQDDADCAWEAFEEISNAAKFVICDLHEESIAFDGLSTFNWIIIKNSSKVQPPWQRVESVLEQALADSLPIYLMPNITVRPREYPRFTGQESKNTAQNVLAQESAKVAA
jgi:protein gp37